MATTDASGWLVVKCVSNWLSLENSIECHLLSRYSSVLNWGQVGGMSGCAAPPGRAERTWKVRGLIPPTRRTCVDCTPLSYRWFVGFFPPLFGGRLVGTLPVRELGPGLSAWLSLYRCSVNTAKPLASPHSGRWTTKGLLVATTGLSPPCVHLPLGVHHSWCAERGREQWTFPSRWSP